MAAFQEGDNVYLMPFPPLGTGEKPVRIDKRKGRLPVTPISKEGGIFPRWRDSTTVEFLSGPRYYAYDVETKKTTESAITLSLPRAVGKGSVAFTNARLITMDNRRSSSAARSSSRTAASVASARVRRAASTR